MPERILWLVDEYVMKSEMPEGLLPIIERAFIGLAAKPFGVGFIRHGNIMPQGR